MGSEFMPAKLRWKFFYLIKSCFIRYFGCYPIMFRSNFKPIFDILGTNLVQIRAFYVLRSAWKHKTKINFLAFDISNTSCAIWFQYNCIFDLCSREKQRKAWLVPACLATSQHSMRVKFRAWGNIGSIVDNKVKCISNIEIPILNVHILQ